MSTVLGKQKDEREQSKELRNLVIGECLNILSGKQKVEKRFKEALILKLAGTILPRLTEVTGEDGGPLTVQVIKYGDSSSLQVQSAPLPS